MATRSRQVAGLELRCTHQGDRLRIIGIKPQRLFKECERPTVEAPVTGDRERLCEFGE